MIIYKKILGLYKIVYDNNNKIVEIEIDYMNNKN